MLTLNFDNYDVITLQLQIFYSNHKQVTSNLPLKQTIAIDIHLICYASWIKQFFVMFIDVFTVITREAGAGGLSIGVEGPSKTVIDFQDRKDGSSDVTYVCSQPG